MSGSIPVEKLGEAVADALQSYGEAIAADIKEDVASTSREAVKALKARAKAAYPNSKEYYKDWKAVKLEENSVALVMVIHSPRHYMLAHLLEHGHAKRNGGRVEGRPHILPTEDEASETLLKKIKARIEK